MTTKDLCMVALVPSKPEVRLTRMAYLVRVRVRVRVSVRVGVRVRVSPNHLQSGHLDIVPLEEQRRTGVTHVLRAAPLRL